MALKDLLVKAGLVVDDGADALPDEPYESAPLDDAGATAPALIETPSTPLPPANPDIVENRPFEEIYAVAGVAAASYPAERLLKVLDGLRAMDATNRRAAVAAMDAADDSWSIDDVITDATRKVGALQRHLDQLSGSLVAAQAKAQEQKNALVADYQTLRTSIAEQIAQLQEASQLAAAEHAQAIAALDAQSSEASTAVQRERLRVQSEIERLEGISLHVGQPKP